MEQRDPGRREVKGGHTLGVPEYCARARMRPGSRANTICRVTADSQSIRYAGQGAPQVHVHRTLPLGLRLSRQRLHFPIILTPNESMRRSN